MSRALERGVRAQPLTLRGAAIVGLSALALWPFGLGSLDLILFVVGLLGLILVGVATVAVAATALVLRRRASGGTDTLRIEAASRVSTGFAQAEAPRLPFVEIGWSWRVPDDVEVLPRIRRKRLEEEIVAYRRGAVPAIHRRFVVYDVFGLASVGWQRVEQVPAVILPSIGRLRAAPVVRALASADGIAHPAGMPEGDRMEIRRYVPGDSVRHILWKTYARTRELTVRLPERSVDRAKKTVAFLVTGAADEPAAAAARVALEAGALGDDWVFGTDGSGDPTADLEAALLAIARSGDAVQTGEPGSGLGPFLERVAPHGGVHCVVFAPARRGPWVERVMAVAAERRGALSFVLATDGVERPKPRALWHRLLFAAPPAIGVPAAGLGELVRALAVTGSPIQVVDRATGRTFGEHHQQRMSGVAA